MDTNSLNIKDVRIILNGEEYMLIPVDRDIREESEEHTPTLVSFVKQLVKEIKLEGRKRTAETYQCALNSFLRFWQQDDIDLKQINTHIITKYEHFLHAKGIIPNSSSFYMRVFRAIYNQAVSSGLTVDKKPFKNVYTGIGKTIKRAISIDKIQKIYQLENLTRHEALARDLFLFSLYTRGMSFIDMAYLKKENLKNGILTYQRHKTKQEITIRWETQMQEIINKYPSYNNGYLLPIIKRTNGHEISQYRECQRLVNNMLKSIGQKAGITEPLTMYVARHSWASIVHSMNVPISLICNGMGHTSEHTTQIYLKSLDSSRLDDINAELINAVCL